MSGLVRFKGALAALAPEARGVLLQRSFSSDPSLTSRVQVLLQEVRSEGDAALRRFARQFDGATLDALEVPRTALREALEALDPMVRRGLERAQQNLLRVARAGLPPPLELEVEPGVLVGRRADPLARVGVYAPGGTAAYPSSVLMGVVPALAAGVGEVVICSPPGRNGLPAQVVLAAAELSGARRVFAVGGAGAIGAMTYGTRSVPRVDRIVGPGNAWVAEAKRQVAGDVEIDSPAGPSELLVVADARADATLVARELLAQAEHDPDACVVALVLGDASATAVLEALTRLFPGEPRRAVIEQSLGARGAVLSIASLEEAWPFVEAFAGEHVLLALEEPSASLHRVRNAGTVFLGSSSSVAFGDYLTGSNHVLPTAGAARRCSGLSVLDFVRWQTWQRVTPRAAAALAPDCEALARSEGLFAHAAAAAQWRSRPPVTDARVEPALRPALAEVRRYVPTRPPCAVDLTDNTNLFGPPPSAARALAEGPIARYPDPYVERLRSALAAEAGVRPEEIVTGCGSDDLLDAAMRAFAEPGDRLAWCPPTFGIVPTFARTNGVVPHATALRVEALCEAQPRLIYLCAPNNPTGGLLPDGFLEALLAQTRAVVLLDEAYVDYAGVPSRAAAAAQSRQLIVIRTLSKAFGLAGLRIGWAAGPARLIAELEKARGPYKVGTAAERAALAALGPDRGWVRDRVRDTIALRERFAGALKAAGYAPLPSDGNFVLVPVRGDADAVAEQLRTKGVSVRAFPKLAGLGDAIRITIGPWELLTRCLEALP
jgi:histidinol dehydrogenase